MRIFVSEFLTGGAWAEEILPASLRREGAAMLGAIVSDLAGIAGCRVVTTWDRRGLPCPFVEPTANEIEVDFVSGPHEEAKAFDRHIREADAVLIIAPEFQNFLADRCRRVHDLETESLNCTVQAIRQCTDKLSLARLLESLEIPTIPTRELTNPPAVSTEELEFPLVIKPRDGAGSQDTFLIQDEAEWSEFQQAWAGGIVSHSGGWIVQPYIPGRTLSVAAIVGDVQWNGKHWLEVFPLAEQQLTRDGRFGYLGGRVPHTISLQHVAHQRVREVVKHLPGLSGYVGLDLLVPQHQPEELLIVEINPRLTTSYLGYRALAEGNIAKYLLPGLRPKTPLRWHPNIVRFTADGAVTSNDSPL